jgi:hypothetical protein
MRLGVLTGIVAMALVAVPAVSAKAIPRLSTKVAAPGNLVTVDFGRGATSYLAPLEVYLVRTSVESQITGRKDRRLRPVGKLGKLGQPIEATRLRFRVPHIPTGRYTLAVWFKGTQTHRWHNLAEGLWRAAIPKDRLVLQVARRN